MDAFVTGLAGVIVWTAPDRFEPMARFYRDLLGLPVVSARPGFVAFGWGDVRLTVTIHSELDGTARDPLRIMVNLATVDIEAAHRRLAAAGVRFLRPPEREHWGGWVATMEDPDGNLVQLLQFPGPSAAPQALSKAYAEGGGTVEG